MEFRPFNFDALASDTVALCRWLARHFRRWHQAREKRRQEGSVLELRIINFDALISDTVALCRWFAKHVRRWHQQHANKNHRRDDRR